jgi:hypothetical protein
VSDKITISKRTDGFSVTTTHHRWEVELEGPRCRLAGPQGARLLVLHLSPSLDGDAAWSRVVAAKVDGNTVELDLEGPVRSRVRLSFSQSGVVCECEIQNGTPWSSLRPLRLEGTFAQVRNFDPDLACFDIPQRLSLPVQICSGLQAYPNFFQLDWGNYMMPPYLLALGDAGQYVGVGLLDVPGCPIPFDSAVTTAGLELKFDYGKETRSGAYSAVPVAVFPGPTDTDILRQYSESLRSRLAGAAAPAARRPDWWSGAIYTTWGDQVYRKHYEQGRMAVEAGAERFLSAGLVDAALERLAGEQIFPRTIVLDEGWSENLGDWRAGDTRFGGDLAAYIASKQREGYRIVLHFNPFLVSPDSQAATTQADFLLKDSSGSPRKVNRGGRDYFLFDWSGEACRSGLLEQVAAMVSAVGLNADGVKLSGTKFALPADAQLADPSFGRGERYLLGVLRDIHGCIQAVKPEAVISLNCLNPLFGSYFDVVRAGNCSEVNHDCHVLRAATASWLMGDKLIDTDDWAAYGKVLGATTFAKVVAGIPNLFSAFYRGDGRVRVAGAAGGHPMQMTAEQYHILSAAWRIYELAGAVDRAGLNVDYERMEFSTAGDIDRPPFLRTYQGGNVLAAYTGSAIYVTSLLDETCLIDLPRGFEIASFDRIDRTGSSETVAWRRCLTDKALFQARSCREDTFYYQIRRKP